MALWFGPELKILKKNSVLLLVFCLYIHALVITQFLLTDTSRGVSPASSAAVHDWVPYQAVAGVARVREPFLISVLGLGRG